MSGISKSQVSRLCEDIDGLVECSLGRCWTACVQEALKLHDRAKGEGDPSLEAAYSKLECELNVTKDALHGFFAILGREAIPADELKDRLLEIADTHIGMLKRSSVLEGDISLNRQNLLDAEAAIRSGKYDSADKSLEKADQEEQNQIRIAEEEAAKALAAVMRHRERSAAIQQRRGEIRLAQLDYLGANGFFSRALELVSGTGSSLEPALTTRQAETLYRLGRDKGDNDALIRALSLFKQTHSRYLSTMPPAQAGWLEARIGMTLRLLGERQPENADIFGAVEAYRSALSNFQKAGATLEWGRVQVYLGNAFHVLAKRELGVQSLKQALAAYIDPAL
jgi:tetratricopeptide (TPR) repeat protein